MQLSDTTNKNGLIQECEFWCRLPDGTISGTSLLLKVFVNRLNRAYDRVLPILQSGFDTMKWDDTVNHTKHPVATFDISSGIGDYQFLSDQQGNSILNIVAVHILVSSSATEFTPLDKLTLDDVRALQAMSPNPSMTGIPSAFVERNSTIFFDVVPNYSATAGGKLFFERSPSYFTSDNLTKTPGIPEYAHVLLAQEASIDWLAVNKPNDTNLIQHLINERDKSQRALKNLIDKKHPTRRRVYSATSSTRSI
jgi:hypothetical protein